MTEKPVDIRPWYKEPWPWVAIAVPGAAVIMGIITFYLAVTNPDYIVVDEDQYRKVESELRAQQVPDNGDGEH